MKITFKLMPIRYADKDGEDQYLVREKDRAFFSVPMYNLDYKQGLQMVLEKEFSKRCVVARSIWVENTEDGLNIYTIIGCPADFQKDGYEWMQLGDLNPEDFDDYDGAAVNFLKFRTKLYTEED